MCKCLSLDMKHHTHFGQHVTITVCGKWIKNIDPICGLISKVKKYFMVQWPQFRMKAAKIKASYTPCVLYSFQYFWFWLNMYEYYDFNEPLRGLVIILWEWLVLLTQIAKEKVNVAHLPKHFAVEINR